MRGPNAALAAPLQRTETHRLEFAHIEPWARGGNHSVDNVGLRCHAHNDYEAVRDYGPLFMARKVEAARGTRESLAVYRTTHWSPRVAAREGLLER